MEMISNGLVAGLAFFVLVAVAVVCITVYHVMTDPARLNTREKLKELETQREIERMKVLGPLADKNT